MNVTIVDRNERDEIYLCQWFTPINHWLRPRQILNFEIVVLMCEIPQRQSCIIGNPGLVQWYISGINTHIYIYIYICVYIYIYLSLSLSLYPHDILKHISIKETVWWLIHRGLVASATRWAFLHHACLRGVVNDRSGCNFLGSNHGSMMKCGFSWDSGILRDWDFFESGI